MITIFDWFGYDVPYKERYRIIKEAGFDGVLLYWSNEFGNIYYKHNPELARHEGLFIENIHTSFENINDLWIDSLNGNEITDYLLQCVDDCHKYEIPTMIATAETLSKTGCKDRRILRRIDLSDDRVALKDFKV